MQIANVYLCSMLPGTRSSPLLCSCLTDGRLCVIRGHRTRRLTPTPLLTPSGDDFVGSRRLCRSALHCAPERQRERRHTTFPTRNTKSLEWIGRWKKLSCKLYTGTLNGGQSPQIDSPIPTTKHHRRSTLQRYRLFL